jgi:hypothetical protein
MNSQILEKVEASGVCGIKKAELKKIFGSDFESSLNELLQEDKIIVDNKGVAHYVWSKENYVSHISQNDPKFKILSKIVKNLENSVNQLKNDSAANNSNNATYDFQNHFDNAITNLSTSLGWVPFSSIRQQVCESRNISTEKFYSLTSSLIEENPSRYEISTGGQEGIQVRGLLHGYVRRL